jgi:hypothetical protein
MPTHDDLYDDDDILGDEDESEDNFGATKRRIQRLLKRRAALEALLPVVRKPRQVLIKQRIKQIDRVLAKAGITAEGSAIADRIAASGVEGVGGLEFQANAPPGLGRLVRLPFYPVDANVATITEGGASAASEINPIFTEIVNSAAPAFTSGAHLLETPAISWAVLRIVGFETQQRVARLVGTQPGPLLYVEDLQIGGGANLFTHEDFADARIYDADQPEFCGLRDYPILKSPNTAEVTVQAVTDAAFGADAQFDTVSCSLLCEVLVDDNYGAHVPGPYARKGALVRQGGSFA